MDFNEKLKTMKDLVEDILKEYFEECSSVTDNACAYSVEAGGKRLRPIFLLAFFEAFYKRIRERSAEYEAKYRKAVYSFAAALEMIHTYSLVHDDLPDMDNDSLRRGKPTTHTKYGAAMGILAGDALLNEAFSCISKEIESVALLTEHSYKVYEEKKMLTVKNGWLELFVRESKALKIIAECAGRKGMILGQEIDVLNEGKVLNRETLQKMYELKTSKLLVAAFCTGAVLGGATDEEVALCEKAAVNLGIAFQIQDDILDVTGDEGTLGKPVKSDEKNNKRTYVSVVGLEQAKKDSYQYTGEAIGALQTLKVDTEFIECLMNMLLERRS